VSRHRRVGGDLGGGGAVYAAVQRERWPTTRALAYAASCQGAPVRAAELLGASEEGLFHDTANYIHHLVIRDRVVRPTLDAATFEEAIARGGGLPVARILADHQL
jgi:hypothetical protein